MAYTYAENSSLRNRCVLRDGLFNKYINCTFTFKCIFDTFVRTPLLVVIHLQVSAYKA
jgi:hypothetical protein